MPSDDISGLLEEDYGIFGHSAMNTPFSFEDGEPEQAFNRRWGYLPPFDEDAVVVIESIIANPEMAKAMRE